ncbi:MAG: hypothetical protein R3F07_20005 [Opitutaceae bacterium]
MNQEPIDELLGRLRLAPRPAAPDLRREVRAAIRHRRAASRSPEAGLALFPWKGLLGKPWIAAATVAVALVIGSLPEALTHLRSQREADAVYARRSLHFDVFAPVDLLPGDATTTRLYPR